MHQVPICFARHEVHTSIAMHQVGFSFSKNLVFKNFMERVVIIEAHDVPKKFEEVCRSLKKFVKALLNLYILH